MDWSAFFPTRAGKKKNPTNTARLSTGQEHRCNRPQLETLEDRTLLNGTTISGQVFSDLNSNSVLDAGETPIAGSRIELHNANGTVIAESTTDTGGFYEFTHDRTLSTDVMTAEQSITIPRTVAGFSMARMVDQFDPNLGELIAVEIINEGSITSDIRAENSSTLVGADIAAVVSGSLTLSGPGFSINSNVTENAGSFQATQFDGEIDFSGSSGKQFAQQTATAEAQSVTLTDADVEPFIGAGQVEFIETVQVNSTATGGGNVLVGINSEAEATFTVRYRYRPDNCLKPGEYTIVQVEQPALGPDSAERYFDGFESRGTTVIPNTIGSDEISVTLTNESSRNNNFAEILPSSLSGFVYHDRNNDGQRKTDDEGGGALSESGIPGVNITLTGADDGNTPIARTLATGPDGSFAFTGLRPGEYTITEEQPNEFLDGKDAAGSQGGIAGNDEIFSIGLQPGTHGRENNFGEVMPASLSGFVYEDLNDNGVKDAGEQGIGNVPIQLVHNDVDALEPMTTQNTAADGSYRFDNLQPGEYVLEEIAQPQEYADGTDTIGSQGGSAGNDVLSGIVLDSGASGINNNFGELIAGDVGITKTANPNPVAPGGTINYTLSVSNQGPSTAENVEVVDTLPAGVSFVSAIAPDWTLANDGHTLEFKRDELFVGAISTISIEAVAPATPGTYSNTAIVSATTPDDNPNNNEATAAVTVPPPVVIPPPTIVPPIQAPPNDPVLTKAVLLSSGDFWFRVLMANM